MYEAGKQSEKSCWAMFTAWAMPKHWQGSVFEKLESVPGFLKVK